jgi:hypothetical protein
LAGFMGSCGHFAINRQDVGAGEFIVRAGPVLLTMLVAGGFMAYALWHELAWARWLGPLYWVVVGLPTAALAWPDIGAAVSQLVFWLLSALVAWLYFSHSAAVQRYYTSISHRRRQVQDLFDRGEQARRDA